MDTELGAGPANGPARGGVDLESALDLARARAAWDRLVLGLERSIREHPAAALAAALGVGFVVGRLVRRR